MAERRICIKLPGTISWLLRWAFPCVLKLPVEGWVEVLIKSINGITWNKKHANRGLEVARFALSFLIASLVFCRTMLFTLNSNISVFAHKRSCFFQQFISWYYFFHLLALHIIFILVQHSRQRKYSVSNFWVLNSLVVLNFRFKFVTDESETFKKS